jgi:hypothetical protein
MDSAAMRRWLARYRPYVVTVACVLVVILLPSVRHSATGGSPSVSAAGGPGAAPARVGAAGAGSGVPGQESSAAMSGTGSAAAGGGSPSTGGPTSQPGTAEPSAGGTASAQTAAPNGAGIGTASALAAPDCDRARGRIKVSFIYAPPCVIPWPKGADNGGATSSGVTGSTIKIVGIYAGQTAAQNQQEAASWADYVTMFESLFRTWGRHVETVYYTPTGTDDASQHADAIAIADMHPFAAIGMGELNQDTLATDLAARHIIVCCYTAITLARAKSLAPYLWGSILPSPEGYELNFAQYVCQRLLGYKAQWAGEANYQVETRKFGLLYPDTWNLSVFQNAFSKCGGKLTDSYVYGYESSQYAAYQERAQTVVTHMKADGVTTVLDAGGLVFDPITTKTATSQEWFPEWVMAGTGGQDLDVVGRLDDQTQWRHAFGLASFPVGGDPPLPLDYLYHWYWGSNRGTDNSTIAEGANVLYWGIHDAGPDLTPLTFRDGLFALPPSGGAASGGVMSEQVSFGNHGFWPWVDYNQGDDFAEVWWDPTAQGKDVLTCSTGACAEGVGKYRYLNGGQRRTALEWPKGQPSFFNTNGTALWYTSYPPGDAPPPYPCVGCPSQTGG